MPNRTFPDKHPVRDLFEEAQDVKPYPAGVVEVPKQIPASNFFPGGAGIWCGDAPCVPPLPIGGVMILGQDFHTLSGYEEVLAQTFARHTVVVSVHLYIRTIAKKERCLFAGSHLRTVSTTVAPKAARRRGRSCGRG